VIFLTPWKFAGHRVVVCLMTLVLRATRLPAGGVLLLLSLVLLGALPGAAQAQSACTPPVTNEVACENTKPGADPQTWQIDNAGDDSIQGFATAMSVNRGQSISFKIKSTTSAYTIDILRLGWYAGDGARRVATNLTPTGTSVQPACRTFTDTGLIDCGNWSVSRTWNVPSDAVSGVYIAHLKRNDGQGESHITFVVRDDASNSDIVLQTSDQTWQAYNKYGGNSLYDCVPALCPPGGPKAYKAAYAVSYNRPLNTEADSPGSALFRGAEYSMIRFLERNGYSLTYISGVDTHSRGQLLLNHDLFISSGHDEYWSRAQRDAVEGARGAGVNLAFFSGNLMFWRTRFAPSADGANTPNRTLISYKDTHFEAQQDPVEWTGTWRDPRFAVAADRNVPENALTGLSFEVNSGTTDIMVPWQYKGLRMWRNTDVANLSTGQSLRLAPSTLGYEWDVDADNEFRPAGQFRLSSTTATGLEMFIDHGSTVTQNGTATHNLTMYRAPSGARVFNSGTVQWAWGLDEWNGEDSAEDRNMQQATVNLFADLGAQPATRMSNLSAASATTDTTRPTSTITSPPATVANGARVTLSGTAADAAGGVVAGVEVSTDGGTTWHPATGTTSWTYSWLAKGHPSARIKTRAVDDSGNIEVPGAGVDVAVSCPCTLWGPNVTPPQPDSGDTVPIEVGVKFRSDAYGTITGVRFYKAAANTGIHTGSLWTTNGERLAQATFTNETASGWQSVSFDTPVQVMPGVTYIASYHAPAGHYAVTGEYFYPSPSPGPSGGQIVDSPPLRAVRNAGGNTNGVFSYGATSSFPTNTFGAANYWVDVSFTPTPAPGAVTGVTATSGGLTSANVSWTAPVTGGTPTSYRITPFVGSTAQPSTTVNAPATSATVTGLTTGTSYRFTVQAVNPTGSGPASALSNAVTPLTAVAPAAPTGVSAVGAGQAARVRWTTPSSDGDSPITGYTVTPFIGSTALAPVQAGASATSATVSGLTNGTTYTFRVTAQNSVGSSPASAVSNAVTPQATILQFDEPTEPDSGDPTPVELGVKFRADHNGSITGIRFFKASTNTGTHVGTLWSSSGQILARATFAGETASGWQTVTFASPVSVTAGTTYVASYFAPSGHYSATSQGLASGIDNPPLHAIADSTSANGVYAYAPSSTFPSSTYRAANYWVDVMYAIPAPGAVSGVAAAEGGRTSANVSWTAPASGGPVTSYRITPYVGTTALAPTTVNAPATAGTVTGLTTGTTYRFTVRALNANGGGPESAQSNPVTPQLAVAPSSPTAVVARPATRSALVTWSPSAANGDSPITGQTVTPYVGTTAQTPVQVGAGATSATVTGLTNGTSYTFRVTASNDAGTSPPSAPSAAVVPQATIFDFETPGVVDSGDGDSLELGVKFRADFSGAVTGIRFYKSTTNTGTHVGSLWNASGQRLAQATFTNETSSGWQSVMFASPVNITPDTTYIASYHAPNGHYSVTGGGLSAARHNAPLHTVGADVSANGVFAYGGAGTFPTSTWGSANYWVDVLFDPAPPPGQVTGVTATAGEASASVSWTAPSTGGPVTEYEVTPFIGTNAQPSTTVTGTPPATSRTITGLTPGTAYNFRVRASNPTGAGQVSAASNTVTPLGAVAPSAPTDVTAQADSTSALIGWTAPADGGSPVTSYAVTPFAGSTALPATTVGGSVNRTRVTGLSNGTSYTFRVTATNAAGTSPASVASGAVVPRASLFELATPNVVDAGDTSATVLGVKFTSDLDGTVTGLRFYKSAANTGTHVGTLWSAGGESLRQGTFTDESASGWQTLTFSTPVSVTAGTTYIASYTAPNGRYSVTGGAFSSGPVDNPPLHALANPISANGVYAYSSDNVFPANSWNATNYWVDVLFAPAS
jgi:hypothetical protein